MIHKWTSPHSIAYASCTLHIADFLPTEGLVLSLGCGTADCALKLRKQGLTIICTDFSKGMLAKAVQNHKSCTEGSIVFALCDAAHLPFKELRFQTVYARGVLLSYVPDPAKVLAETNRVLKPGGKAAFDAMNWESVIRSRGPDSLWTGSLWRSQDGRMFLETRHNSDKKQVKEKIELDPSGQIAGLLAGLDRIQLFYARTPNGERIDERAKEGHIQIQETGAKTTLDGGRAVPSYFIRTPALFESLVEREAVKKEGKVAWFFDTQDLERLFKDAGLQILRVAPLGNLHRLVWGAPSIHSMQLAEFARQNLDKIAAIEKALHDQLKMEKSMHIFVAAVKPALRVSSNTKSETARKEEVTIDEDDPPFA
jgi:SAM-dependent methyltransferase